MKRHRKISKSEMMGFILLIIVMLIISFAYTFRQHFMPQETAITELTAKEKAEMEQFYQQIKQDSAKRAKRWEHKKYQASTIRPFAFDPNIADSATFRRLGLKDWQVSNILKYRNKGGKWRKVDDFSKLYGLSKEDFEKLRPFIHIQKSEEEKRIEQKKAQRDSLYQTYPKKFSKDTILHLNETDTTLLKKIPGIGSYYAKKICRYRERLGGFINVEQLKEIEGLPQGIEKWFAIPYQPEIKKTHINRSDFKGLLRHPYLNYEQVKDICNYIRKYGKIQNLEELSNSQNFTQEDFERLRPYLSFD